MFIKAYRVHTAEERMKIKFVCVGKLKNDAVRALFYEYVSRIRSYVKVEILETKDTTREKERRDILEKTEGFYRVVLSAEGKQVDSEQFSSFLKNLGRDVALVIGGPEGVSKEAKGKADMVLSLSKMTFPHELSRVMIAEQVYRACTILKHEKYHK